MVPKDTSTKGFNFFLPKYTEATMFLTSLITIFLLITEPFLREIIIDFFIEGFFFALITIFISFGFFLSIYYAFATRDMKVVNSEIIKTEYSDHLPILIEIEV